MRKYAFVVAVVGASGLAIWWSLSPSQPDSVSLPAPDAAAVAESMEPAPEPAAAPPPTESLEPDLSESAPVEVPLGSIAGQVQLDGWSTRDGAAKVVLYGAEDTHATAPRGRSTAGGGRFEQVYSIGDRATTEFGKPLLSTRQNHGGRFHFEGLPPGTYGIGAVLNDADARVSLTLRAGEHRHDVELTLQAHHGFVRGRIIDLSGEPVVGLKLTLTGGRGRPSAFIHVQETSSDGGFVFRFINPNRFQTKPNSPYSSAILERISLHISDPDYAFQDDSRTYRFGLGGTKRDVRLVVMRGVNQILGRVTDMQGRGVDGVPIVLSSDRGGALDKLEAVTGIDGHYGIDHAHGRGEVKVKLEDTETWADSDPRSYPFDGAGDLTDCDFRIVEGGFITGTLPPDHPGDGWSFELVPLYPSSRVHYGPRYAQTIEPGARFTIGPVAPGRRVLTANPARGLREPGPGLSHSTFRMADWVSDPIDVKPGETIDLGTIRTETAGRLTGRLTHRNGAPAVGKIRLRSLHPDLRAANGRLALLAIVHVRDEAQGEYAFERVAPGRYEADLLDSDQTYAVNILPEQTATLDITVPDRSGTQWRRRAAWEDPPRKATLSGEVIWDNGQPAEGTLIFARPPKPGHDHSRYIADDESLSHRRATCDEQGRFRIENLPAGQKLVVRVRNPYGWHGGDEQNNVDVESAQTLLVEPQQGLRVTLRRLVRIAGRLAHRDESRPVNGARFRIVAGDGSVVHTREPSFSADGRFAALARVPLDGMATVLVEGDFPVSRVTGVELAFGETTDLGTVVIGEGFDVTGYVVDLNGTGVTGARVFAQYHGGPIENLEPRYGPPAPPQRAKTDASGRFSLTNMISGPYLFAVHGPHHEIQEETLDIARGSEPALTIGKPVGSVWVTGLLLNSRDDDVVLEAEDGASLETHYENVSGDPIYFHQVPAGHYRVRLDQEGESIPLGDVVVEAGQRAELGVASTLTAPG